jgi:hypothetical protein
MKQLQSAVMNTNPSKKVAISIYNQISSIWNDEEVYSNSTRNDRSENRTKIPCGKLEIHQESWSRVISKYVGGRWLRHRYVDT